MCEPEQTCHTNGASLFEGLAEAIDELRSIGLTRSFLANATRNGQPWPLENRDVRSAALAKVAPGLLQVEGVS